MSNKTKKQNKSITKNSKNWRTRQVVVEIKDGLGDVSVCPDDVHVVIVNHDCVREQQLFEANKGKEKPEERLLTKISISWCDQDVEQKASEMGIELTKREVSDVLSDLERRHDADVGISWVTIACIIDEVVSERDGE